MANKTLTAKVRFDTKSAEASLNRLAKKINNVQNAVNRTSKNNSKLTAQINKATIAQNRLTKAANKTANTTKKIETANRNAVNSANKLSGAYNSANRSASNLSKTVKRLAATYLGFMGTKAIISTSDTITATQNKLNTLNGGDKNLTQEQMDKMYTSSNKVRMDYTDMLANASKSMTLAGGAFQNDMDNAIRFQEIMAETYALGGASAPEMSTSMYQMIQALGSGTLQGDELRSVREGAPLAYQAIEQFAQGVYNTTDSLKDMASEGKITSDIVVAAIMDAGTRIDAQFEETAWTFSAVWNRIKSTAVKAFEPVSNMLSEMLNKVAESDVFEKLEIVFWNIAKVIMIVFQIIYNVVEGISTAVNWVADNWDWLSKVILSILTVVGLALAVILFPKFVAWLQYIAFVASYYLWLGATSVASALKTAAAWAIANWQLLLIIAVIAAIVLAVIWLSDSFEDACGMIVGGIMAAISVVWNAFVTLTTLILKNTLLPIATAFDNFANVLGNLFNDPIGAIVHAFGNMADVVLSLLQTVAKGIDAVFGSNLEDTVKGWRDGLSTKTDELAEKWGNGTYEEKSNLSGWIDEKLNDLQDWAMWDTSAAYNTGYEWGNDAGLWIKDKLSGLGLDGLGEKLGLDFGDGFPSGSEYDVSGAYTVPEDLLSGIGEDVGDMKDAMELSNDELDYLRRLADMEWRNEFTTAEIKVDMTNHNTVNGDRDLDGIVEYLSDVLRSEMTNVAYGVHY